MAKKETFARVKIDNSPQSAPEWTGTVPYLNYWSARYRRGILEPLQANFFKYLKDCIKAGEKANISGGTQIEPYLSLYRDELISAYESHTNIDKDAVVKRITDFILLYPDYRNQFASVFEKESVAQRKKRLSALKRTPTAEWVPLGRQEAVDGHVLTRGAFYLGKHLKYFSYDAARSKFRTLPDDVEGPVVDPSIKQESLTPFPHRSPSTYAELTEATSQALLHWLEGETAPDSSVLIYYLAGIEFRLLADTHTTREERVQLIHHLHSLLSDEQLSINWPASIKSKVLALIDHSLSRFFVDDAEAVLPSESIKTLPVLAKTRLKNKLAQIDPKAPANQMAQEAARLMPAPKDLPKEFVEAFYTQLQEQVKRYLSYHGRDFWGFEETDSNYSPIEMLGIYEPSKIIKDGLSASPMKFSKEIDKLYSKATSAYRNLLSTMRPLLNLVAMGGKPLSWLPVMPEWCNPSLLPGVEEAKDKLLPAPGQDFKMVKVSELLSELYYCEKDADFVDQAIVDRLRFALYKLGMSMTYSPAINLRLRYDDTIGIYSDDNADLPVRGTLVSGIYMLAWLIQADGAKDSDFALIDRWIEDYTPGAKWIVAAKGTVRWLAARKLTFSAKRKKKAASMSKYPKKQEELQRLMLQLVAGAENVSPKRMKRLETIYEVFGFDPVQIHSDIHRLATASPAASAKTTGKKTKAKSAAGTLDKAKLKEMAQSTLQAQKILSEVFAEEEKTEKKPRRKAKAEPKLSGIQQILAEMAQKESWSQDEFAALCKKHGETPGAALEKLNDMAYDKLDEPVADDDGDTIYVDTEIAKQLL